MNAKDVARAPASSSESHISRRDALTLVGAGMVAVRASVADLDQDTFDRLAPDASIARFPAGSGPRSLWTRSWFDGRSVNLS
jgi:hypothetical protein